MAGVEVDLEPLAADAMPRRGLARKADGTPTTKTQRNFTDPDSHLMQSGGTFLQGYNCQVAVDSDHQVIVAVGVSNQAPDVEHHEPALCQLRRRLASITSAGRGPIPLPWQGNGRRQLWGAVGGSLTPGQGAERRARLRR